MRTVSVILMWTVTIAVTLPVVLGSSCEPSESQPDAGDAGPGPSCQHDTFDGPDSATPLVSADGSEALSADGFICPLADQDWYSFNVPTGHHLLEVALSVRGPLSPVQPTYAIYECDGACISGAPDAGPASCCESRAIPDASLVSDSVEVTHCLDPGDYFIVVRDQGDDGHDGREPRGVYHLEVSSSPDPDTTEPNDGPDTAQGLSSVAGESRTYRAEGQISCRGDQDWYVLDSSTGIVVGDRDLLQVELQVPLAEFQPQYRIIDAADQVVASVANTGGAREATDIGGLYWLEAGGRYYVVIEDDDNSQADLRATYSLTVRLVTDSDANEPNNEPEEATDLGRMSCGASWQEVSATGTVAATNDVDIYRAELDGSCVGGVLRARADFSSRQDGLEPSVRIVRAHPTTSCTFWDPANPEEPNPLRDSQCRQLMAECDIEDLGGRDCAGIGNLCLSDGVCAGAAMCLPNGACGANIIERHPDFCGADGHCHGPVGAMRNRPCSIDMDCAPQERVETAVPLGRNPDPAEETHLDQVYIVIQDYGSDAYSPDNTYTLNVSTRADPDENEPNEVYNPLLSQESRPRGTDVATPIDGWPNCITGFLSYERDQDVFLLPHPCPDTGGCTLEVSYSVGQGPVEVYAYTSGAWDNLTDIDPASDTSNNPVRSGSVGGTGDCLPANDNLSENLRMYVRDLDLTRDFSAEQGYELCFSITSESCLEPPCQSLDGQCWYPD